MSQQGGTTAIGAGITSAYIAYDLFNDPLNTATSFSVFQTSLIQKTSVETGQVVEPPTLARLGSGPAGLGFTRRKPQAC